MTYSRVGQGLSKIGKGKGRVSGTDSTFTPKLYSMIKSLRMINIKNNRI